MNSENTSDNTQAKALNKTAVITGALISMAEFVLLKYEEWKEDNNSDCQSSSRYILKTKNYAEFLKQPLVLGMFIPCKENGEVINEPSPLQKESDFEHHRRYYAEYLEAKERVLFKGFEFKQNGFYCSKNQVLQQYKENKFCIFNILGENSYTVYVETIEDLVKYNLILTDNVLSEYFS